MPHLNLSPDHMQATLTLAEGEAVTPEAARACLAEHGVVFGLCEKAIASLAPLSGPAEVVLAWGQPPIDGADAEIAYMFRAGSQGLAPVIRADGTADFRNLGAVEHVTAGQVLARRTPPRPGREGRSVRNHAVKPKPALDQRLAAGEGAALSDDGLTLTAVREGNPHRRGNLVLVLPRYTVAGSVSLATGNIRYEGDLLILGHVEQQMEVHATGNVSIRGNVEGGRVVAGGAIVIEGGVRHQAELVAADDVTVKFIEGSTARCRGSLGAIEDIVHCRIDAGEAVVAGGAIVGGALHAGARVEARTLGARLGTPTLITVSPPVVHSEEQTAIAAEREEIQQNLARISPKIREAQEALAQPSPHVDVAVFRKVLELASQLAGRDQALADREAQLPAGAPVRSRGAVVAREGCHPGVHIQVGIAHLAQSEALPASTLVEERGHIRILPYIPHAAEATEPRRL